MSLPDSVRFKFRWNPVRGRRAVPSKQFVETWSCPPKKPWAARPPKVVFAVRFYLAKLAQAILQRRGLGIERAQWFQSEAFFDCLENRKRVVLSVVHKMVLGQRSDNDSGNARTIAPDAGNWRCHVIPAAAVFVIGHNDERIAPIVAVFHC